VVALVGAGRMPAESEDELGGHVCDAAVGNWGEWDREVRCPIVG